MLEQTALAEGEECRFCLSKPGGRRTGAQEAEKNRRG